MRDAGQCPQCGAELRGNALEGLCPDCLGKLALGGTVAAGVPPAVEPGVSPGGQGIEGSSAPGISTFSPGGKMPPSTAGGTPAATRFGDYELLGEIARGGMGVVHKARQLSLNRTVALKMITAGQFASKEFVHRFRVEASAAAVLQHANIVAVHEVGVHEGQHFFSMDYVAGKNLAQIVRDGPLQPQRAARYVQKIAEAIHYAHQSGILHRDLKPANVLIDQNDQPRITDFGLAKQLNVESSATLTGEVMGTPGYMPPEQASGNRGAVKAWSDVYSIGAILYSLLTGRAPFAAGSLEETLNQVLHQDPVSLRLLNPAVPRDLNTICLKCLEKEPAKRFATAQLLADELTRFLNHEPILAHPISTAGKAWRWCRRKPALAATGAVALLAVVIGFAGVSWQWQRADAQARKASENERQSRRLLYASDMNLAQQSLKQNNLGKARRLLERHRARSGEEDLRGWEWRYLWQLTRSSALTLTNRPTRGSSVSFSPDGTRLAVGWLDGQVDLWDVTGRRMIRALTDRGNRQPGRVDFSPVRNLLVATSEPEVVTLYDLDSGRETSFWRARDQGSGKVRDLSFSMDGSKLVIYVAGSTVEFGDAVYVLNVASAQVESRHATPFSHSGSFGAAQISPNNRLLYIGRSDFLNQRCSLQCLDLSTSQELWQTELLRDQGLTSLAISPDGRLLVSASGWEDSAIRVWDAATGRLLVRLDGHTAFVTKLAFSGDGRQLISGAGDQTIRFWDTGTWRETKTLRGHAEEINAIAISEPAHLVASASKDGDVLLWRKDGESAVDGYRRLPEDLHVSQILPLDHSRVLLLPSGRPPDLIDLKRGALPVPQPQLGASSNVLGWFGTNILCLWNQTNQILVRELEGDKFRQRGSVSVDSNTRPNGLAYNANRQLLAWDGGTSSPSVYAANLAAPGRRIELRSDVPGLLPFRFSEDGTHLAAWTTKRDSLHAWNVETGRKVASIGGPVRDAIFAAGGRVLVVALQLASDHEIAFYNLNQPERAPRRVSGRHSCLWLALSPDGEQVAAATEGGQVFLFDASKGQLSGTFNGHLNAADSVAFSPDGRRLISTAVGQEAVKLWDVTTRQELLNLVGSGSGQAGVGQAGVGRWSPDGNFILLAGTPWQTWGAPTWEEIAVAEAKEKTETKQP